VFWLIPVVAAVLAAAFVLVGLVPVARSWHVLRERSEFVGSSLSTIVDPDQFEQALARINRDLAGTEALLARAAIALREIRAGLGELRLGEAMVALRVAWFAIKALRRLA
jgi:hypothetical protein